MARANNIRAKTMERQLYLLAGVLSTGLLLSTPNVAKAQLTGTNTDEFQHIEQPLPLKAAMTTLGIGLIGFELWWFLFSRPKTQSEQTAIEQGVIEHAAVEQAASYVDEAVLPDPILVAAIQELPPQTSDLTVSESPEDEDENGNGKSPKNNSPEKLIVGLCALYNGIEMARDMLVVEHRVQPKFSMGWPLYTALNYSL